MSESSDALLFVKIYLSDVHIRNKNYFFFINSGPTAGMRAVRILHDLEIAGKKLVAKVDAKNKLLLDNYKEEEESRNMGNEDSQAHEKKEDADVIEAIQQILSDHRSEMENYEAIQGLYAG